MNDKKANRNGRFLGDRCREVRRDRLDLLDERQI